MIDVTWSMDWFQNMANKTILNSSRENDVEAQVEFLIRLKLWKGLESPVIDVSVKNRQLDSMCS